MSDVYLIWSGEHNLWRGPGGCGYVRKISQAGRYTKADAIGICARSIPGTSKELGALSEIPMRLEIVEMMQSLHHSAFPHAVEDWE